MFATLTKSEREKIKLGAVEKKYYKDEIIYEKNMTCQYIYIIMRGRGLGEKNSDKGDVREELSEDVHVKKGLGAILSFANIIGDESGKCLSQAVALNDCVFTAIKVSILKDLMADNPDFEAKIYLSATGRSVRR
jgi:signal-transduction protein with cAMP-binding, CBS, and nucleotidyltransferase domain